MDSEMYTSLESEKKEIHNRLKIEFSIGVAIILAGGTYFALSIIRNLSKK